MVFAVSKEKITSIIEEGETEINEDKNKKFEKLFSLMKKYFKKNKIIAYGGTAMDMHLPESNKIYKPSDFPDYDCFSMNPKKDSENLAEIFSKANYRYIEIKYALHDGTYKLYVDFQAVCDLTKVTKDDHKILMNSVELIDELYVVSTRFLKSSAYLELAIPKSSLFRWNKTFERIKILESEFKNNRSRYSSKTLQFVSFSSAILDIIEEFKVYAISNDLVLSGNHAIKQYLNIKEDNNSLITNSLGLFQCLSIDDDKTIDAFEKILKKHKCKNIKIKKISSSFVTPYTKISITYSDNLYTFDKFELNICTVFSAKEHCYSYSLIDKVKYASIFYIFHMLYYSLYAIDDYIDRTNVKNIINALIKIVNEDHFKTQCYGKEMTIEEIRKTRWDNKKPVVLLRMD